MPDGLETRVERLERENRWLKRGALLALAIVGAVVVMGQTAGPKISDKLITRSLTVVDEAGRTRALLSTSEDKATALVLTGVGKSGVLISSGAYGAGGGLTLINDDAVVASLIAFASGPSLFLTDPEGYQLALGVTDLVTPGTGTKTKRSAASLVMFDKEKNVIWRAP